MVNPFKYAFHLLWTSLAKLNLLAAGLLKDLTQVSNIKFFGCHCLRNYSRHVNIRSHNDRQTSQLALLLTYFPSSGLPWVLEQEEVVQIIFTHCFQNPQKADSWKWKWLSSKKVTWSSFTPALLVWLCDVICKPRKTACTSSHPPVLPSTLAHTCCHAWTLLACWHKLPNWRPYAWWLCSL